MSTAAAPLPSAPLVRYFALAAIVLGTACGGAEPGDVELTYTGRSTCAGCHAAEVEAFSGSDHDMAMDRATSETVLGDFDDASVRRDGVDTRFTRRDGAYYVTTDGPDGRLREFEVLYTFGVRPLQQYLVELEPGRIQRLPWSWDSRPAESGGQRWFHTYGDQPIGSEDILHWTRPSQNWNRMCADCHSTNLVKAYDVETDRYATTWSEIDVSCESCHGPASEHVAWAQAGTGSPPPAGGFPVDLSSADLGSWVSDETRPTARRTEPRRDDAALEACARCHSHRTPIAEYEPGARFADSYRLSLPREPLYYADGQVKEEVFVYGSFLQSKMYREGVTCSNCHEPHSATLRLEGNGLCTQCHSVEAFDSVEHHRHEPEGAGSACVDCHMPTTTFMQVDERRDHGFRVPRPTLDEEPNACIDCHGDRDVDWVAVTLDEWHGPRTDSTALRVASALQAAERGDPSAGAGLIDIVGDTTVSEIRRAAVVSYLDRYPAQSTATALLAAVRDESPLVRAEAVSALRMLAPADRVVPLAPLLEDSTRLVRVATARALAAAPLASFSPSQADALDSAFAEFEQSRLQNADDPAATIELADYHAERGALLDAESQYRRAMGLEPGFVPAYLNLADLYRAVGRDDSSDEVLQLGRSRAPDAPLLAYATGLAHVRAGRLEEAVAALGSAAALAPTDARFPVAHALALERAGRVEDAIDVLEAARDEVTEPTSVLLALVDIYRLQGLGELAIARATDLVSRSPRDPRYRELVESLRSELGM